MPALRLISRPRLILLRASAQYAASRCWFDSQLLRSSGTVGWQRGEVSGSSTRGRCRMVLTGTAAADHSVLFVLQDAQGSPSAHTGRAVVAAHCSHSFGQSAARTDFAHAGNS